jgi:hypothetical protein
MPPARRVRRTLQEELFHHREQVDRAVGRLQNQHTPTHPIYAPDGPLDPVETQIAWRETKTEPEYYRHGAWHEFGSLVYAYASYEASTGLGSSVLTACDLGELYTNGDEDVFSIDTWANSGAEAYLIGSKGLGVHQPGLYWVSIGVEATKIAWASGDPLGYQLQVDNHGHTFQLNDPAFGSKSARGFHPLDETDGSEITGTIVFDASFSALLAIDDTDDDPAGAAPITITAIQNSPEAMNGYPNLLIIKLDSNNFGLFF